MKKRLLSLALCGALLCGALAGCGGNETPSTSQEPSSDQTEDEPKILTTAVSAELNTLYPLNMDVQNNIGTKLCYEGLVNYENGEVVPCLAESWEFSDDGTALTFHLKEGVTFHDGTPFNAEAVKTDFEFAHPNPNFSNISAVAKVESIEVVDEYTVTFHYPNAYFAYLMDFCYPETMVLVSPAVLEEGNYQSMNGVVGTGPYVYEEIVDGDYVRFVRNENYWQEGPGVDTLTFTVVPEDGSRIAMLQTGEADIIDPVPAIDVARIENDPTIVVDNFTGITYRYVTLNTEMELPDGRKPFADKRVRQALNYAFDSNAYAQVVFNGFAVEPTSIFSQNIMYYSPQTPYTPDLDKAKELMKEAGFEDGFDVQIIVDNTTIEMKGAEFVKQQLSQINVNVELLANESTANAELTSAPLEDTTVQMWYVNWGSGSYEADGSMRNILHGDKMPPEGYNTAFWNNEEFNELLDSALKMTDTEEIAEAYAKAQAIAWEECPWIFLGNNNTLTAHKSYVSGIKYKPAGELIFQTISMDH